MTDGAKGCAPSCIKGKAVQSAQVGRPKYRAGRPTCYPKVSGEQSVDRPCNSVGRPAAQSTVGLFLLAIPTSVWFRRVLEAMYMQLDNRGTSKAYRNIPYNGIHQSWRNWTKIGFKTPKWLNSLTNPIWRQNRQANGVRNLSPNTHIATARCEI